MKEQFIHRAISSFYLWFDHYLLDKGETYINTTGKFHYYSDSQLGTGIKTYGSAYKQFVFDSSITGATIPTGVYVNGSGMVRADGIVIDFDNGRILSSSPLLSSSSVVTGSFARKEVNVYFTDEPEESLIIDRQYQNHNKPSPRTDTYIKPYDASIPAVFISVKSSVNEPFAFGGEDKTTIPVQCVVISDDQYKLDGILSIFSDAYNQVFASIPFTGLPINEYGDLKTGYYNYSTLQSEYTDKFFISSATTSKLVDKNKFTAAINYFVGFIDFDINITRYPRA